MVFDLLHLNIYCVPIFSLNRWCSQTNNLATTSWTLPIILFSGTPLHFTLDAIVYPSLMAMKERERERENVRVRGSEGRQVQCNDTASTNAVCYCQMLLLFYSMHIYICFKHQGELHWQISIMFSPCHLLCVWKYHILGGHRSIGNTTSTINLFGCRHSSFSSSSSSFDDDFGQYVLLR